MPNLSAAIVPSASCRKGSLIMAIIKISPESPVAKTDKSDLFHLSSAKWNMDGE